MYGSYALYRRLGSLGLVAIFSCRNYVSEFVGGHLLFVLRFVCLVYGVWLGNAFEEVSGDSELV